MLTELPGITVITLESMWKELCEKRKLTDNPPPKTGPKFGDRDQVSRPMHHHHCMIPSIFRRSMTVGTRISNWNQLRLCVGEVISKEQTHR
jgi:hypothetical protein